MEALARVQRKVTNDSAREVPRATGPAVHVQRVEINLQQAFLPGGIETLHPLPAFLGASLVIEATVFREACENVLQVQ